MEQARNNIQNTIKNKFVICRIDDGNTVKPVCNLDGTPHYYKTKIESELALAHRNIFKNKVYAILETYEVK